MVQGCVLSGVAILDRLEPDPLTVVKTGDRVRVRPREGLVEVLD